MSALLEVEITRPSFSLALPVQQFAETMHRSFEESLLRNGAGLIRRVMGITPPGSADGASGGLNSESRARGEKAIARDMAAIFIPVALKHKRAERWPDPGEIHLARLRSDSRYNGRLTRGHAQAYYVDVNKLRSLYVDLKSHVGRMAAGWMPAARALGVSAPAWVARHSSLGSYEVVRDADGIRLIAVNASMFPKLMAEMQRRLPYATEYQFNAMTREMAAFAAKELRQLGIEWRRGTGT